MKFKNRLLIYLLCLCVVPFIIYVTVSTGYLISALDSHITNSYIETLQNLDTLISVNFNNASRTISYLLKDPAINNFIKSSDFSKAPTNFHIESDEIDRFMANHISEDTAIKSLIIISPSQAYYAYNYPYEIDDVLDFIITHGSLSSNYNSYKWIGSVPTLSISNNSLFTSGILYQNESKTETFARIYMFIDADAIINSSDMKISIFNEEYNRIFSTEKNNLQNLWDYPDDISSEIYNYKTSFNAKFENRKHRFFTHNSKHSPFIFVGSTEYTVINSLIAKNMSALIIIITATIIIIILLSLWIKSMLFNPLQILHTHIRNISEANFIPIEQKKNFAPEISEIMVAYNHMSKRIFELIYAKNEEEAKRLSFELKAMEFQINPHFLYNTLSTIRIKAMFENQNEFANIIQKLSTLLRQSIKNSSREIPICQEIMLLNLYVDILQYRYNNALNITFNTSPDVLNCKIRCTLIQPIIENGIFHGLSQRIDNGEPNEMVISFFKSVETDGTELLNVSIKDNGPGMTEEKIASIMNSKYENKSAHGIGIHNVSSRIKLLYGNRYGLSIHSIPGEYTCVTVHLPFEHL